MKLVQFDEPKLLAPVFHVYISKLCLSFEHPSMERSA